MLQHNEHPKTPAGCQMRSDAYTRGANMRASACIDSKIATCMPFSFAGAVRKMCMNMMGTIGAFAGINTIKPTTMSATAVAPDKTLAKTVVSANAAAPEMARQSKRTLARSIPSSLMMRAWRHT